jgi:hypothetical protein
MKKVQKFFALAFLALTMVIATSGCAKPQPAGLTDEQVGTVVENILTAINANDYQKFTQDFSDAMKTAFPESQFTQLRNLLQQASGNYVSMGTPTLLNQNGYAVYRIPCKYEKEDVIVTVTFAIGGDKVEGLFFDSTNLRSASK